MLFAIEKVIRSSPSRGWRKVLYCNKRRPGWSRKIFAEYILFTLETLVKNCYHWRRQKQGVKKQCTAFSPPSWLRALENTQSALNRKKRISLSKWTRCHGTSRGFAVFKAKMSKVDCLGTITISVWTKCPKKLAKYILKYLDVLVKLC